MNLTPLQRLTAQSIISIFETGRVEGDYSAVSIAEGDTGVLSYGKHQATLKSGRLYQLLREYCALPGALHGEALAVYLPRLRQHDESLRDSSNLQALLRLAGRDPEMRRCQDALFEAEYWIPALMACDAMAFVEPLTAAVVYDSFIHGSWKLIRERTGQFFKRAAAADVSERRWIARYIGERHVWLTTHRRKDLQATAYRTETFRELIAEDKWDLALPFTVRGIEINEERLGGI